MGVVSGIAGHVVSIIKHFMPLVFLDKQSGLSDNDIHSLVM